MSQKQDHLASQQFIFGDFVLQADGVLLHRNLQVDIPPKELAVLTALLQASGALISKNELLEKVWLDGDVAQESLCRCIYALRRILCENKTNRYIETVYGKGYRFCRHVAFVSAPPQQARRYTLAILPFRSDAPLEAEVLHTELVQHLSGYAPSHLSVLPASLTRDCQDMDKIMSMVDRLAPDYYLAGQIHRHDENCRLNLELVRTEGHRVLLHDNVQLPQDLPAAALRAHLGRLVVQCVPALQGTPGEVAEFRSMEAAIAYLNGRNDLQQYTPASLKRALALFCQQVSASSREIQPYCCLAECYLSMAQLGLFDQEQAIERAWQLVSKAVELKADHPQALSLLARISSLRGQSVIAETLFRQARLLAPDSIDIYYHYAWHLFLCGKLEQAQHELDCCLGRDPSRIAASILKVWISYCQHDLEEAIALGMRQLNQHGQDHPVLQSNLGLLLAVKGDLAAAAELARRVRDSGNEVGMLAAHNLYIRSRVEGPSAIPAIRSYLRGIDSRHVRTSLLPLVLEIDGVEAAQLYWQTLEKEDYVWLRVWRFDPRLQPLFSGRNMAV
ncbi:HilA/EilA family virulence transcriptional regulator [Chromobacterium vaccinii]|uniref:HilA/EilA family virulence transcriptional regulator n=1 Tax=Chromobacterium vaccinii TaxID=1108595 RepID=UPI001E4D00EC|nr:HilA/EilA family virulence transcriptional regulator [Chromobacterium vaccinii]MCD4501522.1 HilA/EilA family virulence transcriptional regulator [Chromobacterium vaccinii]